MCGILAVLNASESPKTLREKIITRSKRIRHRGPDWSGVYSDAHAILAHERLAIVDVSGGASGGASGGRFALPAARLHLEQQRVGMRTAGAAVEHDLAAGIEIDVRPQDGRRDRHDRPPG